MKESRFLFLFLGVILGIVLLLCILLLTGAINENVSISDINGNINSTASEYTNSSISGYYEYLGSEIIAADGNKATPTYKLYLCSNGIFRYTYYDCCISSGEIGNYYFDGNKIILNFMFNTSNGTDLFITRGSKELTIGTDGIISGLIKNNAVSFSKKGNDSLGCDITSELADNLTEKKIYNPVMG